MSQFRNAFAERNRVLIALIGSIAMAVIFALTFVADSLPLIGGGKTFTAHFAESGGIRAGNEVRVAGVKSGTVISVELHGKEVLVKFRIKDVTLGDQSTAGVSVKTILGQKFLDIDPLGHGELKGDIPLERTTTPYDVNAALSDFSSTVSAIDTPQLEKSFEVLSKTFENTPESVRTMLTGLTSLSRTISSRDGELAYLFAATRKVSRTLAGRNTEFAALIQDGDALLTELQQRREAVSAMLESTARLGRELRGLVDDNRATLAPALAKVDRLSVVLRRNQDNLDASLRKLGPYYRVVTSALGNGRWIDTYVCGLFGADALPLLDPNAVRNCHPKKGGGR
ncbi:MCE family protein [Nocardioides marmoriginsengisoli]|uniref:MCE family protein n=1 Tax=Nocardioides marmoriginsengisoli TaxID=661483 RepID=A0A3N0CP60_9ACTN|nr:MCE family protein [Nocardioides marmoriginsengisoli]RNL64836.1 MCE family protein [Nocardioides marmoriginsengisoli]